MVSIDGFLVANKLIITTLKDGGLLSLTVVGFMGSGDSFGSGGQFQTCILVDGPDIRFAMDFGLTPLVSLR